MAFRWQFNVLQVSEQETQDGSMVWILAGPNSMWTSTYSVDTATDALSDFNSDISAAMQNNPPVVTTNTDPVSGGS